MDLEIHETTMQRGVFLLCKPICQFVPLELLPFTTSTIRNTKLFAPLTNILVKAGSSDSIFLFKTQPKKTS